MLVSYLMLGSYPDNKMELCLMADKTDAAAIPIPLNRLRTTESALLRVGPTETATVAQEPEGMLIKAMRPAKMFLTLDLPTSPGISVEAIRLVEGDSEEPKVFYREERFAKDEWREWQPLTKI